MSENNNEPMESSKTDEEVTSPKAETANNASIKLTIKAPKKKQDISIESTGTVRQVIFVVLKN